MNATAPAEKEKNTQQAEQKKKQRQLEALALPLRETENANAQTQKPETQNTGALDESSNMLSNHNGIPAVHGSQTAYSKGSELMHDKLKSSLEQTGDLNHPETRQKEMDYKKTLSISDLRDYHDIKSGTYAPKTPSEQAAVIKAKNSPEPVVAAKAPSTKVKKEEIAAPAETIEPNTVAESEGQALSESPAAQSPIKAKQEAPAANQPKQEKIALQNASPKTAQPKGAKANKQEKIINKGNPQELLASLSSSPATQLAGNFNAVQAESTPALNAVSKESASKLPKVNASSGSAFSKSKTKNKPGTQKAIGKTSKKTVKASPAKTAPKETPFPEKEPLKKASYSFQAAGNKKAPIDKQAQNQFDAVRLNTAGIPTKMQENASLDLSGEASVDHLSIEQNDASQDLSIKKSNATRDIHKDYGENDIIKEPGNEVLKTKHALKGKNIKINPIKAFNPEGIDEEAINSNFEPTIQSKIGAEKDKYATAQLEHDQKVLEEENAAGTKIEDEKSKSKDKQLKSVREAQGDVNKSRTEWQEQLNKTETDFAKKAGDQAKTTMGKIQTEKTAGESKAQEHINKANQDARKKKEDADKEAEQKKSEKKKESGGFFGWLADKASAFINALKDALNFIFTKLREAVKAIFEFAKKLVLATLELARKAIINFIKGFASLLKGFLDIALAAFPAIRDRLKAKIDHYVAVAEKYVNQAFDMFKKAVVAIIDFLAETVDALLGALQAVYNFVLDAIDTIVTGLIKMLEFILDIEKQYNLFEKLITGIQEIWNNPKILENYVIGFIAPFIEKIPGEANSQFKKFFAQSGVSIAKHITGVWIHLQPILAYMASNWWGEIKKMIWYLVWPFAEGGPVREEAPKLWTLIPEIWNNISNNNFSKAVDGGLAWIQTLNTVVGTFSGWITIGSVLIGGIIGAFFGGVGAIPGAMAGLEFATAVGEGLLISMLATESSIILKSIYDILTVDDDGIEGEAIKKKREEESSHSEQNGEQSKDGDSITNYESNDVETGHDRLQYAYQRIANSGFALAIIGVFIALGYLATNIVKALKPKFSPKIAKFKAKVKNTKAGRAYSKGKAKVIEKGYKDYRPEWMEKKGKSNIPEEEVKPIQIEEKKYEESIFRQDNKPYSPEGSKEGRIKSHINEEGNLTPADKNGNATVSDHVKGSEPMKSKSPYTSFSEEGPGIGKTYGDNVIEVDIKRLEADIASGKVSKVEVLRPEKVQAELQAKIDQAMKRFEDNPTPKNQKRVDDAVRDLNNSVRDKEILIKGEIPSEYFKVKSTKNDIFENTLPENGKNKRIEIASGVKEDPFDFQMNKKGKELTVTQNELLDRLSVDDGLGEHVAKIGKREVTATDLAALTYKEGKEFAIIMDKQGQRYLVKMGSYKGGELPHYTDRLLMHSHPFDWETGQAKLISPSDIECIISLNQKYSYMVTTEGEVWKFTHNTIPNNLGEVVRKLNYNGWFNPINK